MWQSEFVVEPGDSIVMTDGACTKTLTVADVYVTDIDAAADTMSGHATPYAELDVVPGDVPGEGGLWRLASADAEGSWHVDFSVPDPDSDAGPYDIVPAPGWGPFVEEIDEDGNTTWYDATAPYNHIWAALGSATTGTVDLGGWWIAGRTLTLTIDRAATTASPDWTASQIVQPFGRFQFLGSAEFPVADVGFEVEPGDVITMSDGKYTHELVAQPIAITSVNAASDRVSGTAEPLADVLIELESGADAASNARTVTADESGYWEADFSTGAEPFTWEPRQFDETGAHDIEPGDVFRAQVADEDGDLTFAQSVAPAVEAYPDAYTTAEDGLLTVAAPGLLANDVDHNGTGLTAILETDVSHGVLLLAVDGSFVYVPDADFFGTDSFSYRVSSSTSVSEPATVEITVTPVNDAPVANAGGPYAEVEGDTVTLDGSAPRSRRWLRLRRLLCMGSSTMTASSMTPPGRAPPGAMTTTAPTRWRCGRRQRRRHRHRDDHGDGRQRRPDRHLCGARDGRGRRGHRAEPVRPVGSVTGADTAAGFEYAFDCGDGSGLSAYSATATVTCPTSESGTRTVEGRIRDKDGGTSTYTATVEVTAPNQAPVAYVGGPYAGVEGGGFDFYGNLSFDPDADSGDSIVSYVWDLDDDGVFDDASGDFVGLVPGDGILDDLFDDDGVYPIVLQVTDSFGATGTATTTVTVTNRAPWATFTASASVVAGEDIVLSLSDPYDWSLTDIAAG